MKFLCKISNLSLFLLTTTVIDDKIKLIKTIQTEMRDYMKKILTLLLCASILSMNISVFAEKENTQSEITVISTEEADTAAEDSSKTETETEDETVAEVETATSDDTEKEADEETAEAETDATETETQYEADVKSEATEKSEETATVTTVDPQYLRNTVKVNVYITPLQYPKASDVTLSLYSSDDKLLDTKTMPLTAQTKEIDFVFEVGEYTIGDSFKLKLDDGLTSIQYYSDTYYEGQSFSFPTYSYLDGDGIRIFSDGISISALPFYEKAVNVTYNGKQVDLYPGAKLINENTMIPIRKLAQVIGFDVYYDEKYNTEVLSLGPNYIFFNVDTAYTTVFGNDLYATAPTVNIDGTIYVSLRTFADAVQSTLDVKDKGTTLDINMSDAKYVSDYYAKSPVNKWGIASRTNYMVWVSLSEYKVRLYEGSQYKWKLMLEAPCAIGAPGTPSITGSYEYLYKARWDYGTYYVGPCLVFHGGYALHSVLLYQNGSEYDGRVGVQISHGCIRLKKKDIDFIAKTIPVGTRIYCTR